MQVSMSSELNVLSRRLDRISEQHRRSRDFTLESLRDALREVIACFPGLPHLHPSRHRSIPTNRTSATFAAPSRPRSAAIPRPAHRSSISFRTCCCSKIRTASAKPNAPSAAFSSCASSSSPARSWRRAWKTPRSIATARCSRSTKWAAPPKLSESHSAHFHGKNPARRTSWRNAMLASSTHDTKRSEDVRARINVLSEIPAEWYRAIRAWQRLNQDKKILVSGEAVPSANEEYFLYQTLVGAWPLDPMNSEEHRGIRRQNSRLHGKGSARGESQYQLDQSQHRVRSRLSQLSRCHPRSLRQQALPRRFRAVPGEDRERRNLQLAFADPAENRIAGPARFLSGNRSLELQPCRSRQSPAGELRSPETLLARLRAAESEESSRSGRSPGCRAQPTAA